MDHPANSGGGSPSPDVFDQAKPKKTVRQLSIPQEYTQSWDTRDAFREFYQNWKDAITESFNLSREQFTPKYAENDEHTTVTVSSSESRTFSPQIYGFIRFYKKTGKVKIVNANARLQPKDLQLGQTTKSLEKDLIGCHGNGLKLAAVVMARAGYKVRIETGGHNVNFFFKGTNFSYYVHPSQRSTSPEEAQYLSSYTSRICKDVAVTLGPCTRSKLELDEFRRWLHVSIDIRGFSRPSSLIQTRHGDLILDPNHANKTYFKGLLLPRFASDGEAFKYGYNFHNSRDIREKKKFAEGYEQAQLLCRIWTTAIQQRPHLALPKYITLLQANNQSPDVRKADELLGSSTAKAIFDKLRSDAGEGKFYYCSEARSNEVETIKEVLKREPIGIPLFLWNLLRGHSLIRTAEEETSHRFTTARGVIPPETTFSRTIQRFIRSCLLMRENTNGITVSFLASKDGGVEVHFDKALNQFKISDEWLHFDAIHTHFKCRVAAIGAVHLSHNAFLCDHIAENLSALLISKLPETKLAPTAVPSSWRASWSNQFLEEVREKLRQMPRAIEAKKSPRSRELIVSWEDGESQYFSKLYGQAVQYHVTLHDEGCRGETTRLLHTSGIQNDGLSACGCSQKLAPQDQKTAVFDGLNPTRKYFPMVAENGLDTFYGIPPNPIHPAERNDIIGSNGDTACNPSDDHTEEQDIPAREDEENAWEAWQKEIFPKLFDQCIPPYMRAYETDVHPLATLESRRLQFRFERDEYIMVIMKCSQELSEISRYLLYVHSNFPAAPQTPDDEGALLVTQYSFLRKSPIFRFEHVMERNIEVEDNEMLLHFQDFNSMGERNDATFIPIKDLVDVKPVEIDLLGPSERLQYTVDIPSDLFVSGLFCRFAVRCGGSGSACLTPVASHLLPRSKHWAKLRYQYQAEPVVLDFSPGVVGLAEGFRQSGCVIDTGVGFDPVSHLTWKANYPTADVYDGCLQSVLSDIKSLWPNANSSGTKDVPMIGILSIPDKGVALRGEQIREGLDILKHLQGIFSLCTKKLDFLVLALPPWLFFEDAYIRLFDCVHGLLQSRYCIHLKRVSFAHHGIPQDGEGLILLASALYSPAHWEEMFDKEVKEEAMVVLADRINDLAFQNLRGKVADNLVCRHPFREANIYNHNTGKRGLPTGRLLNWDSVVTIKNCPGQVLHPERGDMLTVREVARIQGFPDTFIFFGAQKRQYQEVVTAFPPPVGRKVAELVKTMIREFCCLPDDDGCIEGGPRGLKRRRGS